MIKEQKQLHIVMSFSSNPYILLLVALDYVIMKSFLVKKPTNKQHTHTNKAIEGY